MKLPWYMRNVRVGPLQNGKVELTFDVPWWAGPFLLLDRLLRRVQLTYPGRWERW